MRRAHVFAQLLRLLTRYEFQRIVDKYSRLIRCSSRRRGLSWGCTWIGQ